MSVRARLTGYAEEYAIRAFQGVVALSSIYVLFNWFAFEGQAYKSYWPVLALLPFSLWLTFWRYQKTGRYQDEMFDRLLASDFREIDRSLVLYLRPFVSDGRVSVHKGLFEPVLQIFDAIDNGSLDGRLRKTLHQSLLVRFDGQAPPSRFRKIRQFFDRARARPAIYVTSKEAWLAIVERSITKASWCIVVPPASLGSSTNKEIGLVFRHKKIKELVFVMPSKSSSFKTARGRKVTARALWEQLRELLQSEIHLPRYQKPGGFVLWNRGAMQLVRSLGGVPWSHERAMKRIFVHRKLTGYWFQDSCRIVRMFVWILLPMSIILPALIVYTLVQIEGGSTAENERGAFFLLFIVALLFLKLPLYAHYCGRFGLETWRRWVLFASTLVTFFFALAGSVEWMDRRELDVWLAERIQLSALFDAPTDSESYRLLFDLFRTMLVLFLVSIPVYVVAFLNFFAQKTIRLDRDTALD
ncbi:MAG: hypothetical protein AAFX56_05085 [Pseudomonadota bacterium]